MRCQQRAFSGRDIGDEDIRIRALRLLLRVDNGLPILRPDRIRNFLLSCGVFVVRCYTSRITMS